MRNKSKAELLLLFQKILSGLFPVLTVFVYQQTLSPLWTASCGTLIASIFFGIIVSYRQEWKQSRSNRSAMKDIFFAVLFVAIGFHGLYFLALDYTSAANVSLLGMMEIVFSFLIIGAILGREPISAQHILGSLCMILGATLILFVDFQGFNRGDVLIIIATILAPIGNIFAKRALFQVSMYYIMFWRSILSCLFFVMVALHVEGSISFDIIFSNLPYLLFTGVVFLGVMKVIFLFAVKSVSVTHSMTFKALSPFFALLFAWLILSEIPTQGQVLGFFPLIVGIVLIMSAKLKPVEYGDVMGSSTPSSPP